MNTEQQYTNWKTVNLASIDAENSIGNLELDLVYVSGSVFKDIHICRLKDKVVELGLEMCPVGVASYLAIQGRWPDGVRYNKYGNIYIGHRPISYSGIGGGKYFVFSMTPKFGGYEHFWHNHHHQRLFAIPYALELSQVASTDKCGDGGRINPDSTWIFVKPRTI